MADSLREVLLEAKKNKYTNIWSVLSDTDVVEIWDAVSGFVKKNLIQQKGVAIPGFGTFSFTQVKLDVGNNKVMVSQRPVFILSEKFTQTHGLHPKKYTIPGGLPVVTLNLAHLSFMSLPSFDRDTIDACVREILAAFSRCVASGRPVELAFTGIGRLLIRDSIVKMKFFKNFMGIWDGSGKLVEALQGRPSTADSVVSELPTARPRSASVLSLQRDDENEASAEKPTLAPISEDPEEQTQAEAVNVNGEDQDQDDNGINFVNVEHANEAEASNVPQREDSAPSEGRVALVVPQATTISWDDLNRPTQTPLSALNRTAPDIQTSSRHSPLLRNRSARSNNDVVERRAMTSRSLDATSPPLTAASSRSSVSSCGHNNAGQELCYLCHQRARRNVYLDLAEEKRRKDEEEARLLRDFQQYRDALDMQKEQEKLLNRRHESQKAAAYNLATGEAVATKNKTKNEDYFPSYILTRRALTPPRFLKQDRYREELEQQLTSRFEAEKRRKEEEAFIGRLEQVQLAEDIAAQKQFLQQQKAERTEAYQRALSAQVRLKAENDRSAPSPSALYFAPDVAAREEEQRRRAHELYREQIALVEQRKRDAILKRFEEQKQEEDMIHRSKRDLLFDSAERYERLVNNRRVLEEEWKRAVDFKRERELDERRDRMETTHEHILDQTSRYHRCGQCKRRLANRGQTNVWSETRYTPGCRIMV